VTPPRVIVTIDDLVVDGRPLGSREDVEQAVRAELDSASAQTAPAQRAPLDADRVAAAVASAVDASVGPS
jgi:hypothetical protein